MLSQRNIDKVNRQIESEIRSLGWTTDPARREQIFSTIKELKALLGEEEKPANQTNDILELVDAVRDLIREFRRR